MVATGLPISNQAPSAKPSQPDTVAATDSMEGSFTGVLSQLLGESDATSSQATQAEMQFAQEIVEAADDVLPDPEAALLAAMQAVEMRAAQSPIGQERGSIAGLPGAAGLHAAITQALAAAGGAQSGEAVLRAAAEPTQESLSVVTAQTSLPASLPTAQEGIYDIRLTETEPAPYRLREPVGTAAWSDELGARLYLMADKGHHAASLKLSPEHLGPLEVRIAVKDDQATVWFGAANADTRAALEQALPRLRELFAAQGLALAHSGVFQEAPQDFTRASAFAAPDDTSGEAAVLSDEKSVTVSVKRGLVDAYA